MNELDSEYKSRLEIIYTYISQFTVSNTYFLRNHVVGGAESDFRFMHNATRIVLDTLALVYTSSGALSLFDALWAEVKIDLNLLCNNEPFAEDETIRCIYKDEYLERYQSKANIILLEMGVLLI